MQLLLQLDDALHGRPANNRNFFKVNYVNRALHLLRKQDVLSEAVTTRTVFGKDEVSTLYRSLSAEFARNDVESAIREGGLDKEVVEYLLREKFEPDALKEDDKLFVFAEADKESAVAMRTWLLTVGMTAALWLQEEFS